MVKLPPSLVVHRFPNFKLKLKLGGLLLCLSLLLNIQPTLGFPPVKRNVVYAEVVQEQSVAPQEAAIVFQLPHPGYITTHFSTFHPGIDLCSGLGMPIKPIASGTVVEAGYNFFGLGMVVEVEHAEGYRSLYAHMGKIFVTKGQTVEAGQYLGEVGMTGNTSGPHTHLEIAKDGRKIDPLLLLPEIRKYPSEEDFVVTTSATPSAVLAPSFKPTPAASGSAQIAIPLPSAVLNPVKSEAENILGKTEEDKVEEVKLDIKQQAVTNILNLASPKPSASPTTAPHGGKLSLRNFNLFALKK